MRRIRAVIRTLRLCLHGVLVLVQYLRRRRMSGLARPRIRLHVSRPPSWGAETLTVAFENIGTTGVTNCRYCRLQQFTMDAPDGLQPTFSNRRWYSSDVFSIPAGKTVKATAYLTRDDLCRDVLAGIVSPAALEGLHVDALLCKDSTGTVYRFRFDDSAPDLPDTWSPGLLDIYRRREPPVWARSIGNTIEVAAVKWR